MAYCNSCGKQMSDGAAFCKSCGSKTGQESQDMQSMSKQEARLVLAATKKEGFFKWAACYLVFYDNELLLAHVGKEKHKEETEKYRNELKDQGKGFLKSTIAMIGFWNHYGDRYYGMYKQLIFEEDAKNASIEYQSISKFIFKAVKSATSVDNSSSSGGEIMIRTAAGKIKFIHSYHDTNKKIKGILSALLGKALKYRGGGGLLTINIGGNKDGIS